MNKKTILLMICSAIAGGIIAIIGFERFLLCLLALSLLFIQAIVRFLPRALLLKGSSIKIRAGKSENSVPQQNTVPTTVPNKQATIKEAVKEEVVEELIYDDLFR